MAAADFMTGNKKEVGRVRLLTGSFNGFLAENLKIFIDPVLCIFTQLSVCHKGFASANREF